MAPPVYLVQGAPRFAGYVVVDGTWTMKDALKVVMTRDGNSNVYNYTGYSPGEDDGCDLSIVKGSPQLTAMSLITESLPLHFPAQPTAGQTLTVGTSSFSFAMAAGAGEIAIGATLAITAANVITALAANTSATATLDPQTLNTILLAQITPWTSATALQVTGTCGATISSNPITSTVMARVFVIQADPETTEYGGKPLKQKVKLMYHTDGFVPLTIA